MVTGDETLYVRVFELGMLNANQRYDMRIGVMMNKQRYLIIYCCGMLCGVEVMGTVKFLGCLCLLVMGVSVDFFGYCLLKFIFGSFYFV